MLKQVKYAIEKEYSVALKDNGDHFLFEKETPKLVNTWFLKEYEHQVYVSYEIRIKAKNIYLECYQNITAKYHLQEFFNKVKELNELARYYF